MSSKVEQGVRQLRAVAARFSSQCGDAMKLDSQRKCQAMDRQKLMFDLRVRMAVDMFAK